MTQDTLGFDVPRPDPEVDPRIGSTLGDNLVIEAVLGRGGMGVVYRAHQKSMDRKVAVKVLHSHALSDQGSVMRFLHEARIASKLNHPNVVTVFDFGQTPEGLLYLVMELLEGQPLANELDARMGIPADRVVPIMVQVCDAVHHAHERGLVHRDLKPENVILRERAGRRQDFVKVLDFGIARAQDTEGQSRLTQTGMLCGTPSYMSPEQILGDSLDGRSDIYALGVMTFELLTGRLPFEADTPMRMMMAHVHDQAPKLQSFAPGVPASLEDAVARALSKKAAHRPATALAFAESLTRALETAHIPLATPVTHPEIKALTPMSLPAAIKDSEKSRGRVIFGLVAAFIVAAVVGLFALGGDSGAEPEGAAPVMVAAAMPMLPAAPHAPEVVAAVVPAPLPETKPEPVPEPVVLAPVPEPVVVAPPETKPETETATAKPNTGRPRGRPGSTQKPGTGPSTGPTTTPSLTGPIE